jgi:uncharacterized protein (DUF3084 family)
MNEQLLTIALLLIVVCNLGALLLYFALANMLRTIFCVHDLAHDILHSFERMAEYLTEEHLTTRDAIRQEGQFTRQRIAQVKTRLADEERDDQKAKRKEKKEDA